MDLQANHAEPTLRHALVSSVLALLVATPLAAQLDTSSSQLVIQGTAGLSGTAQADDRLGAAVTFGDFDCDGTLDLAVGVPGEGELSIAGAGAVQVIFGFEGQLSGEDLLFDEDDLGAVAQADDGLGATLASGNFNGDDDQGRPCDDLVMGIPKQAVNGFAEAGMVLVLYGDPLLAGPVQMWSQNTLGVAGTAGSEDQFGFALASGDFDGDGFDDLAVGGPGESADASGGGAVWALRGSSSGLVAPDPASGSWFQLIHQGLPELEDSAEPGERFGFALASGDFDDDGRDDLAIGVPGEDAEAGGMHVLFGGADGLRSADDLFVAGDVAEASMGWALEAVDLDASLPGCELAVGQPFHDVEPVGSAPIPMAGIVTVHKPERNGAPSAPLLLELSEESFAGEAAETGEAFGATLAAGDFDDDGFEELVVGAPIEAGLNTKGALYWYRDSPPLAVAFRLTDFGHFAVMSGLGLGASVAAGVGSGGPVLAAGATGLGSGAGAVLFARAEPGFLFRDGFEAGDTSTWSSP